MFNSLIHSLKCEVLNWLIGSLIPQFLVYLTTVIFLLRLCTYKWMHDTRMLNWNRCERKRSWPVLRYQIICLRGLGKPMKKRNHRFVDISFLWKPNAKINSVIYCRIRRWHQWPAVSSVGSTEPTFAEKGTSNRLLPLRFFWLYFHKPSSSQRAYSVKLWFQSVPQGFHHLFILISATLKRNKSHYSSPFHIFANPLF